MNAAATQRLYVPELRPNPAPLWAVYALMLCVFFAIAGFGGVYSYIWAPTTIALIFFVLVLAWQKTVHHANWTWHPIYLPMLAYAGLILWQWASRHTAYPGNTLTGLVQLAACGAAFFLALNSLTQPRAMRHLCLGLWIFTGLLSLEALLQLSTARGYIYWFHNATYASPMGPYVYHNHYAGCLDLLFPLAIAGSLGWRPRQRGWEIWTLRALIPLIAFASLVACNSRGGVLIFAFEALLFLLLVGRELRKYRHFVLSSLVLLVLIGGIANFSPLYHHLELLGNRRTSYSDRLRVTEDCLHIFAQHFWSGTGFNTFAVVYPAYQSKDNGQLWLFAHNDYAQMLAETGFAGLVCVAAFLLFWILAGWRIFRMPAKSPQRPFQLAAWIAGSGFLAYSIGDFQFHAPANALLFFLIAGMVFAQVSAPKNMHLAGQP